MSFKVHSRVPTVDQLEAISAGANASNRILTTNDPRLGTNNPFSNSVGSTIFGSGRHGDITFDGSAITDYTLSGSTYTFTGSYIPNYRTMTIEAGYFVETNGAPFRILELIGDATSGITAIGEVPVVGDGSTTRGGAAPTAAATNSTGQVFYGGSHGGRGVNSGSNTAGVAAASISSVLFLGGMGGRGGGIWSSGGSLGPNTKTTQSRILGSSYHFYIDPWEILTGQYYARSTSAIIQIAGGSGGNSGAASAPSAGFNRAYNAGGGGGVLAIAIKQAYVGTGFTFAAYGQSPDAPIVVTAATQYNLIGGSAGGGGGAIIAFIGELSGGLPVFLANGGNGSDGVFALGASNTYTGMTAEGGSGGDGGRAHIYIGYNYLITYPTVDVSGGTKGANHVEPGSGYSLVATDGTTGTYTYKQGG
jgi:hypothetical protein